MQMGLQKAVFIINNLINECISNIKEKLFIKKASFAAKDFPKRVRELFVMSSSVFSNVSIGFYDHPFLTVKYFQLTNGIMLFYC